MGLGLAILEMRFGQRHRAPNRCTDAQTPAAAIPPLVTLFLSWPNLALGVWLG